MISRNSGLSNPGVYALPLLLENLWYKIDTKMLERLKDGLASLVKGQLLFEEPMRNHTSFKIGGPVDALVIPNDLAEVSSIIRFANANGLRITVVGNGTKLLVCDGGVDGIVIKIKNCLDDVAISEERISAGAGCLLPELCHLAASHGLSGLEFAVGIPGTVGGALVMNAGAHGDAMSCIVTKAKVIGFDGQIKELIKSEMDFGYRSSKLQDGNVIVSEVEMQMRKAILTEIERKMADYMKWRHERQPLGEPSAGSIFKNPKDDFAGRLIELAGCKGMTVGGAQVSEIHANFIVNRGNATAEDILQLISKVQQQVAAKFGISLVPEIKIIGRPLSKG